MTGETEPAMPIPETRTAIPTGRNQTRNPNPQIRGLSNHSTTCSLTSHTTKPTKERTDIMKTITTTTTDIMKTITTTTTVTTLFNSEAPGLPWIGNQHHMDIDGADITDVHVEATTERVEVTVSLAGGRTITVGGYKSYDEFLSEVIEMTQVVTETPVVPAAPVVLNIESDASLAQALNAGQDGDVTTQNWQGFNDTWWHGGAPDAYGIALGFSEPIADPSNLLAYFFAANMACGWDGFDSEVPGSPVGPVNEHGEAAAWHWPCDLTKSPRDDVAQELEGLRSFMQEGSPVRKTNRSGPKGTRAVIGVGEDVQVFVALDC